MYLMSNTMEIINIEFWELLFGCDMETISVVFKKKVPYLNSNGKRVS